MAYSQEQWDRAKGYYEGGLSLAKIKEKTGIARNTISQRAKKEQWEHGKNADYIEAKEIIAVKKGTEKEQSIICADEIADDNIRRKNLVYGNAELLASQIPKVVEAYEIEKEDAETGKITKQTALDGKAIKELAEANDKISITLGVSQRHANSQVRISNTNATQTNVEVTKEIVTETLETFEDEY